MPNFTSAVDMYGVRVVNIDGSIPVERLPASGVYSALIGNGAATSFIITHNLGTRSIVVSVAQNSTPYAVVYPDIEITTINTITVTFDNAPASSEFRVTVASGISLGGASGADGAQGIQGPTGATGAAGTTTYAPLSMYFSANGDIYFVAPESMTIQSPSTAGTGTLTYNKAVAASPTSFSTATFPLTLATGDILKVTCASIGTYSSISFRRTA